MSLIDTESRNATPALELHRIPDGLIPRDPRLGGACVPVPDERIAALRHSGPVILGLQPGIGRTEGFAASVIAELRALLRLPGGHECVLVPVPPQTVARLLNRERWAADRGIAVRPVTEPEPSPDRSGWVCGDLSRTSLPLDMDSLTAFDVACFCPSWLLGTAPGSTVLTLSPRAAAAARAESDAGPLAVRTLLEPDGPRPSHADLIMLAHGIRALAESEPERFEEDVNTRLGKVVARCAGLPWLSAAPYRHGRDLAAVLPTSLGPDAVRSVAEFLERHAIAYGLADPTRPGSLLVGLYRTVDENDLDRLLGLLDALLSDADREVVR